MGKQNRSVFVRQFEGLGVLDELLALADAPLSAREVVERFRKAQAAGEPAAATIPLLFPHEPHFPDPLYARKLYQNLLGLWDALAAGEKVDVRSAAEAKEKKAGPPKPPHFSSQGPDASWVSAAETYLGGLDRRGVDKLTHAFENRQDELLNFLDEQGWSEAAWSLARGVLFELFCFLELGSPSGVGAAGRRELEGSPSTGRGQVPEALSSYADRVLNQAELQKSAPEEVAQVRSLVRRGLRALWTARRS